jgi:phosphatidate cytidylyltransferase
LLTRILTALPLIGGFVAALYWASPLVWLAIMAAIVCLGAREWAGLGKLGAFSSWVYAALLTLAGMAMTQMPAAGMAAYVLSFAFWSLAPWLLWRGFKPGSTAQHLALGLLVLLPIYLAIVALREAEPGLLLALVGLVVVADSGAYFTGRRFGRHKLAPGISPGKTWEGVAGAALGVALYVLALLALWPEALAVPPYLVVLAGLGLLALSIVGDLLESWIKRLAGVKDSGSLLPGHGGVLDRIDSLTAALPAAALFYHWMS